MPDGGDSDESEATLAAMLQDRLARLGIGGEA